MLKFRLGFLFLVQDVLKFAEEDFLSLIGRHLCVRLCFCLHFASVPPSGTAP